MQALPTDSNHSLQARMSEAMARITSLTMQCKAHEQRIRQLEVCRWCSCSQAVVHCKCLPPYHAEMLPCSFVAAQRQICSSAPRVAKKSLAFGEALYLILLG